MTKIKSGSKVFLFVLLSIIFSLCLVFAIKRVTVLKLGASVLTGWQKEGDFWYYYENGTKKTGWFKSGGTPTTTYYYYLTPTSKTISGVTYPEGAMLKGWFQDDNGYWYYLTPTEQVIDNVNYKEGTMVRGWLNLNGWYYLRKSKNDVTNGPDGALIVGDNLNPTECYEIDTPGKVYCFDKNGKLYNETLQNPRYEITPSVLCRVPIDSSNNSYKMSGAYFFDHYVVYAGLENDEAYTHLMLVDLNDNCNIISTNSSVKMGHANDITYNSIDNKFYVASNGIIYEFQIINNQIVNVQKTLDLANGHINAIAFDDANNKYYSYHSSNLYKFDSLNTYVENSSTHFNRAPQYYKNFIYRYDSKYYNPWFITQGIDYGNNNLYNVATISDGVNKKNQNSNEHNSTFVLVYNGNTGSYKYNLHFNKTYGNVHAETLTVNNDDMYIGAIEYDSNSNEINNIFYKYTGVLSIDNAYNTSVRSMQVITKTNDTVFYKEADFDYSKIILQVTYNDDSVDYVELNDDNCTISNFDKDTIGTQAITATYNNTTYNLNVEVVNKVQISKPTIVTNTMVYNELEHSVTFDNYDSDALSTIDGTKVDAGNYTAVVTIEDKDKYEWTDGTQDDLEFAWSISKATIEKPTMTDYTFVYDGSEKGPTFNGYDPTYMDVSDNYKTNAGNYTAVVSIKDKTNYEWDDDTQTDLSFNWSITKLKLTKPEFASEGDVYEYDGDQHRALINNYSEMYETMEGEEYATNVGDYPLVFKIKDTNNCEWGDGTTTDYTITWHITKKKVHYPTLETSEFTYTGYEVSPHLAGTVDGLYFDITGDYYKTNAGDYTMTLKLKDTSISEWEDGSNEDYNLNWKILRASIEKPTMTDYTFVYDGSEKGPTFNGYDSTYMDISDNYKTNAGNYTAVVSIKDKINYNWSDNTQTDLSFNWSIAKLKLTKPEFASEGDVYEYDGNQHRAFINNYSEMYETMEGEEYATNVGDYPLVFKIINKDSCEWEDGSVEDYNLYWKILKAKLTKPTIDGSDTFTYDGTSKGLSFNSLDSDIMTVSGNNHVDVGSYTTTISLSDLNNYLWDDDTTSAIIYVWSITKANINPVVSMEDYYKNTTPSIPVVTGNLGNGEVTYSYAVKGTDDYTSNPPTEVGEYTVKAVIAATSNYKGATVTSNFKVLNVEPETIVLPEGSIVKDVGVYGALIDSYNNEKGTSLDYTHLFTEEELASLQTLSITEEEYHNVSVSNLNDMKFLTSLQNLTINLWENCSPEVLDLHLNSNLKTLTVKNTTIETINISNLSLDSIDLDKPNNIGYLITDQGNDVSYIKNINQRNQYLITTPETTTATGLLNTNYIINIAGDTVYEPGYYVVVLGDVKADGIIDIRDVAKAYDGLANHNYNAYSVAEKEALDMNKDNKKSILDLIKIYRAMN